MSQLLDLYLGQFLTFVLILTRVSGLILSAPLFGSRGAPMRVRGLLAVALAVLITPLFWHDPVESPGTLLGLAALMAQEVILGLAMGLAVLILLTGLQIAGQIISQIGGLSLAEVFDPSFETNIPILSQLLDLTATAIFFTIGGHRLVLRSLIDSFEWMPPGRGRFPPYLVEALIDITSQSFSLGIRAAAPVVLSLLLAVIVTGVISRALPQLNILAVGFNINALVLIAVLSISIGAAGWIFQEESFDVISKIRDAMR